MRLIDVPLRRSETALPADILQFLKVANQRIDAYQQSCRVPGFVASRFEEVYRLLLAMKEEGPDQVTGFQGTRINGSRLRKIRLKETRFCEWGSGFGVVASMASELGFQACGIEIERELVEQARWLARDFSIDVHFHQGSFIPPGGERYAERAYVDSVDGIAWLTTDAQSDLVERELAPDEFDIIFAYPWPDEERAIELLFLRFAAEGAVLITQQANAELRVRRKVA
ncbi:MAG: class I SAM-dependent methyltransferase [Planctomycetes bacterium]|nr:class I SAM-dependent methyltransferase [Planctomycetota bacterium]